MRVRIRRVVLRGAVDGASARRFAETLASHLGRAAESPGHVDRVHVCDASPRAVADAIARAPRGSS